jgi:hypothetical protein
MNFQSCRSPYFRNFGPPKYSHLGVLGQNDIWVLAPWLSIENTIRGRWWLPPSPDRGESCESVFVCGSFMHQKCSNYALTNLLFGLYRSMWVIALLVNICSPHLRAPTRPSTPEVLWTRDCASTPSPSVVFSFRLVVESIKELEGASK